MRQLEKALNTYDNEKFELAKKAYEKIFNDFSSTQHSEVLFGHHLKEFKDKGFYSVIKPIGEGTFGCVYSNMYEFCEREFGLKKRAVANRIAVAKEFAGRDGKVLDRWQDYSFTQLVVMLDVKKKVNNFINYFPATLKVKEMILLYKAIKKGTFDYLLSVGENIAKINEYLEAEKAGKVEESLKNIEMLEEKYSEKARITTDGELLEAKEEVHLNAPLEQKEMTTRIKKVFRENDLTIYKGKKKTTVETVVKYIIKEIYGDEV